MAKPGKADVQRALQGLRIDPSITSRMLPGLTFEPTIGLTAKRIDKLGIDIRSFHEPLKRSIQKVIAPSFRKNFDSGGRPPWEPYSAETPEVQQRLHGKTHPLLRRSGLMRRTISQYNVWTVTRTSAILDNVPDKIWYAKIHQAGYAGKGAKKAKTSGRELRKQGRSNLFAEFGKSPEGGRVPPIPARPFVMLQPEDSDAIVGEFGKWLEERINKAWPA